MLLPSSYFVSLLLVILTVILWGSWANTQKLASKWRFELFYFDFAIGVFLAAVLLAFTFGTLGYDGFSTVDDFLKAGKRQDVYGFAGGMIFNLGNMLLVAAISVVELSIGFPIALGLAGAVGLLVDFIREPNGNLALLIAGTLVIVISVVTAVMAQRAFALRKLEDAIRAGTTKSTAKAVSMKGVILAVAGGVFMGLLYPIVQLAAYRDPGNEPGLGPYALALLIAAGICFSTFIYSLFFMNLPVEGKPIMIFDYFKGSVRHHLLGITGGLVFGCGLVANLVAGSAQAEARVGPAMSYGVGMMAAIAAAVWGLFYWDEFRGAGDRVRMLLGVTIAGLLVGLGLLSFAPSIH